MLTMLASSTALPGKAKPGASLMYEALHKLGGNPWVTNIITGFASLASGFAMGTGSGDVVQLVLRAAGAGLLVGVLFFVIFFWATLIYVKINPP